MKRRFISKGLREAFLKLVYCRFCQIFGVLLTQETFKDRQFVTKFRCNNFRKTSLSSNMWFLMSLMNGSSWTTEVVNVVNRKCRTIEGELFSGEEDPELRKSQVVSDIPCNVSLGSSIIITKETPTLVLEWLEVSNSHYWKWEGMHKIII